MDSTHYQKVQPWQTQVTPVESDYKAGRKATRQRRMAQVIRVLRVIQSLLGALLSLAIAGFQGRVFWTFQRTQAVGGAWPAQPNVVPTLLLFSVACAALVFDACMVVGFAWPRSRFARWAVHVGGAAHAFITSAKTVSYAISAVISKTSFDYGNATNTNTDLWSWTCTDQAATFEMTQAESNCNTQWASWGFALAQLGLEVFGWIVSILVFLQEEKLSKQTMQERFSNYGADINMKLNDNTPQFALGAY